MQQILFILMIVSAILAVQTNQLRRAVIYLCVFSLISSVTYLLYQAPDVAIAEAIIGSTLSTILFLVAIKKYKIYRVYFTKSKHHFLTPSSTMLSQALKKFVLKEELELDLIQTHHDLEQVLELDDYDLIVEEQEGQLMIFGDVTNYHYDNLQQFMEKESHIPVAYSCLVLGQEEENCEEKLSEQ